MEKPLGDHSNRWNNWLVICAILSIVGWLASDYQPQISSHWPIFLVVSAILLLTGGLLIRKKDRVNARFHFVIWDLALALIFLGFYLLFRIVLL